MPSLAKAYIAMIVAGVIVAGAVDPGISSQLLSA